jgi:hypothetical protein
VIDSSRNLVEARGMAIRRLSTLEAWQLLLVLVALGLAVACAVWLLVWVLWIIRPILAAAVAIGAVAWTLYALQRRRRTEEWSGQEWLGS